MPKNIYKRGINHCNLSKEAIEWINGELLGDGYMRQSPSLKISFQYTSKYPEYIYYVSETLKSFGIKRAGKIYEEYHKIMNCYTYHYESIKYVELLPIYNKWYPNGKKIIPRDIELTPLVIRQWYIGDGYLEFRENHRPRIKLCTCGFPISDVNWLTKQLNNMNFKSKRQPSNNIIYISPCSIKKFLDYIGEYPVECYKYKFRRSSRMEE